MRKLIGILSAGIIFVQIARTLNYMFVPVSSDYHYRIVWHQFYEAEGKIDNLYLGSSHVYQDIMPHMLDELNGVCNFNFASPGQVLNGSYYLLREADHRNELKHVFLELSINGSAYEISATEDPIDMQYFNNWRNTDYMRLNANKMAYFLSFVKEDIFLEACFPFIRYRQQLGDWDYVKDVIQEKGGNDYRTYQYRYDYTDGNGYDEYQKQGFLYSTRTFEERGRYYRRGHVLNEHPMGDKSEMYCCKIIEYCQEKNIPITLFTSPTTDLQLVSAENYDNFIDDVRSIAKKYGVPYYDFNLAKEEYLPIWHGEYFKDYTHLNHKGAEMFTQFFNQVVSEQEKNNKKYFYDSYLEKLRETEPCIYGLYEKNMAEIPGGGLNRIICIASNRDANMKYKVTLQMSGSEPRVIQDYNINKKFLVPVEEHGTCIIEAKTDEILDKRLEVKIDY